jgi:predicted ABC-type ATPase
VPILTVIAGPNGSGKSSLTRAVEMDGRDRLLDPDAVARQLNPEDPAAASLAAGRAVLQLTQEYLTRGVSFALETTLSSPCRLAVMRKAKALGFEVRLIFVALDHPERCMRRIRNRVARGGHFVPDADVTRRYARSIANAGQALRLADIAYFYDNSGEGHRLVLVAKCGVVVWRAEALPRWVPPL